MRKKGAIIPVLCFLLVLGIISTIAVAAAEGVFTIKKVDQNKEPIEGVEFEVYGKPTLEIGINIKKIRTFNSWGGRDLEGNDIYYTEEQSYIDTASKILIEGIGETDFYKELTLGNEDSESVVLKPGKYKISEPSPVPLTGNEEKLTILSSKRQYLLEEFTFEIDEQGVITDLGTTEWRVLWEVTPDNGEPRYYSATYSELREIEGGSFYIAEKPEPHLLGTEVRVDGSKIEITNFALVQVIK